MTPEPPSASTSTVREGALSPAERHVRWVLAAVVLLSALLYLPALGGPFVYDDRIEVVGNPTLRDLGAPGAILGYNPSRTLVIAGFALDWALWGLDARGYHLTNLLLHALDTWLAWRLARRLLPDGRALLATALWALHPMAAESVAYVTGRSDAVCAAGMLLCLEGWLAGPGATARARVWGGAVVALLSKEVAYALPVVLLALEALRGRPMPRRALGWMAAAGGGLLLVRLALGGLPSPEVERGVIDHLGGQAEAWARSLGLWALPWRQSVYHDVTPTPAGLLWALPVALAGVWAWRGGLASRAGVVLAASTLGLSGVLPLREVMAEHRAYLAGFGLALLVAERWPAGNRARVGALLVGVALSGATVRRAWVWADEARLWEEAVEANPASGPAWRALGDAHRLARRFPEAERAYREALARTPDDTDAKLNLGIVRAEQGGSEEARRLWRALLRANPRACAAHNNLAALALREGDTLAAIDGWQASLRACPDDLLAHLNLGLLYARVGDTPRAAFHLGAFLERAPRGHPQRAAAAAHRARLAVSDGPADPR